VFLTSSVLPAKLTPGVSNQDQIHRCSDSPKPRRGRRPDQLVLDVEGLPDKDVKSWQTELSRYYFACGCEFGSVVLLVALLSYVIAVAVASHGFETATWRDLVGGVVVCVIAAGVGKLTGLLYARYRLRMTARSIIARLNVTQPQ
jgi:hypothetical protein